MLLPETLKLHKKQEFEFHYIYFLPWKDQMKDAIEKAGGKVMCFPAKNNLQLIFQYKKIVSYCKENNIDLIHCHLPWAGFVGRLVHAKTKIPTLYTEHNLQERYHILTKKINKLSFNSQTLAIGVSEDVTRSIKENIAPKVPVKTVLNGINTNTFRNERGDSAIREEFNIPKDATVIGAIAVFRFQKRLVEWLQVFREILNKNPKVYGIIVGAGPLEEEIQKELQRLKLEDHVFLPGLKTNVKPYFNAMDIFMMSSSFEGLPLALLEGMSMECAVVSTNAGGVKEVIRHEIDGLTCDVEQWKDLAPLCLSLINDKEKLERLKRAARERVVGAFSLTAMVDVLEKEYENHILVKEDSVKEPVMID